METIRLLNKKTGNVDDYDLYLGNTPQTIMVEVGGVAKGYNSFEALAEDYTIYNKEEK